jgi:hypothetical protein
LQQEAKKQMLEVVKSISDSEEFCSVTAHQANSERDIPSQMYRDVIDWWKNCNGTEKENATYNEIGYGWWKKNSGWELEWEKKFMTDYSWAYDDTSAPKPKVLTKGCVAKNIMMAQVDLIHQLQKLSTTHNTKIVKTRTDAGSFMTKEGKYKRSKPNEYVAKAAPLKLPKHDATSDEKINESNKEEHAVEIEKKKTAKKVQQKKAKAKLTNLKNRGKGENPR